jgi:hypothetical protein
MKRAFAGTGQKGRTVNLGITEFVLLPFRRGIPEHAVEFDGYYQGHVELISVACPTQKNLVGKIVFMKNSHMISCSPYFVYVDNRAEFDMDSGSITASPTCTVSRLKNVLTMDDMSYLLNDETLMQNDTLACLARELMRTCKFPLAVGPIMEMPFFKNAGGLLREKSELYRIPLLSRLYPLLMTNKYDDKQRKSLNDLTSSQLIELGRLADACPWEMIWRDPMKFRFHLKGLTRLAYQTALLQSGLGASVPAHVSVAINVYYALVQLRQDGKHTIFSKNQYQYHLTGGADREQVYDYLQQKAVEIVFRGTAEEKMALKEDFEQAGRACVSLDRIYRNSVQRTEDETLRGKEVPQIPQVLTDRQAEIARHISSHWLTIVEGLPGTGKTSVITWVFSHYKNVIMLSFVGMMVKSLQKRNGRRREAAYTIHHLLTLDKYKTPENEAILKEWLEYPEVVVLEEFSNVSMHLYSKVVSLFPNASKIIHVGDHRQLKPIECGDPMGDLLDTFGSQLLKHNLRVVPQLKALQEAPRLIADGFANHIDANPNGPISFVQPPSAPSYGGGSSRSEVDVLFPVLKEIYGKANGKSILNTHIVVLKNDTRKKVNEACEQVWQRLGVLKKPANGGVEITKWMRLFKGRKITFLQNHNQPVSQVFGKITCKSDPVSNGELAIVVSVEHYRPPARGIKLVIVDSEDPDDDPETKTIWIDNKGGVKPTDIELGYATTTYKTQGASSVLNHDPD